MLEYTKYGALFQLETSKRFYKFDEKSKLIKDYLSLKGSSENIVVHKIVKTEEIDMDKILDF